MITSINQLYKIVSNTKEKNELKRHIKYLTNNNKSIYYVLNFSNKDKYQLIMRMMAMLNIHWVSTLDHLMDIQELIDDKLSSNQ